jgi:hypothetical protein
MTAKMKVAKYTPAMEAAIRLASETAPLNASTAKLLVENDPAFAGSEITVRGVIAKVRSMNLPYEKKAKVSKTGAPVATKEAIASAIGAELGIAVEGLEKAGKETLRAILSAVRDLRGDEADEANVG